MQLSPGKWVRPQGIGAGTRGANHQPDWHVCSDMQPINLTNGHVPGGSVYDDPRNAGASTYQPGQCPAFRNTTSREGTPIFCRSVKNASDCV